MLSLFSFLPRDMKREHTFLIRSLWRVDTWRAPSFLPAQGSGGPLMATGFCSPRKAGRRW